MPMSFGGISKQKVATVVVAADGTGDTTDIQTGIDMLPAGGGVVYVKEGTYTITATIEINKDRVSLFGSGRSTIITTIEDIVMLLADSHNNISIKDIFVSGAGIGNAGNVGIKLEGSQDSYIANCFIGNCGSAGILVYDLSRMVSVRDNVILEQPSWGILINSNDRVLVLGNRIEGCDKDGIYVTNSSHCIICNNLCHYNDHEETGDYDGIRILLGSNDCIINNNVCMYNGRYGINIEDNTCNRNVIMGNSCYHNTTGQVNDAGTNTLPNGAVGTTNLELDDLNYI